MLRLFFLLSRVFYLVVNYATYSIKITCFLLRSLVIARILAIGVRRAPEGGYSRDDFPAGIYTKLGLLSYLCGSDSSIIH
jgi:hypothetical protein